MPFHTFIILRKKIRKTMLNKHIDFQNMQQNIIFTGCIKTFSKCMDHY